jgi:hypothetical protein
MLVICHCLAIHMYWWQVNNNVLLLVLLLLLLLFLLQGKENTKCANRVSWHKMHALVQEGLG